MALDGLEAKVEECALEEPPDEACDGANVNSPYGERLLQPDEIRLLTIVRDTDTLRLTVTPHKFQDGLEYDAVSYVWGAAEASVNVPCNEKNLAVTPTVFEMLQYLDPNRSYWLDSICINQQDSEEKAVQIPLMHRIYSLAAFVVIWMGLPTAQKKQRWLTKTDGIGSEMEMTDLWEDFQLSGNRGRVSGQIDCIILLVILSSVPPAVASVSPRQDASPVTKSVSSTAKPPFTYYDGQNPSTKPARSMEKVPLSSAASHSFHTL
ncbi:hypothetical protein J4E81_000182 [Alternaria sp. BMP 2799]|nr:hypothetical protein J4E81_000182 [Alternaria sp. BMP 2799]